MNEVVAELGMYVHTYRPRFYFHLFEGTRKGKHELNIELAI